MDRKRKIVVVGAGPVGALAAVYAAQRGHNVEVYELRGDPRNDSTTPLAFTKSINLALSHRGISALRAAHCPNMLESILADTIPMYGRMVHARNSRTSEPTLTSQAYDAHGRFICAADRSALNNDLVAQLATFPNVKLFFNHKLTGADFDHGQAWLENKSITHADYSGKQRPEEIEITFDLLIGADGAHSAVRFHMMKYARVSYQQEYIDTLWCEFHIPPRRAPLTTAPAFAISPHHLHIWPTPADAPEPMMFIAIPSADKSFTCTLFAHPNTFASFTTPEEDADSDRLLGFFHANFPGVTPDLVSRAELQHQFKTNPHLPLISIKCTPHHYSSRLRDAGAVIVGDAAHAMVPFYGQGMNAGLEDVRVLFEDVDHAVRDYENGTVPEGEKLTMRMHLRAYTRQRRPAAHAIVDLSMRNFVEMRQGVTSVGYLVRKKVEEWLSVWFPRYGWATQYARVSFSDERYDDVVREVDRQGRLLKKAMWIVGLGAVAGGVACTVAWVAWMHRRAVWVTARETWQRMKPFGIEGSFRLSFL